MYFSKRRVFDTVNLYVKKLSFVSHILLKNKDKKKFDQDFISYIITIYFLESIFIAGTMILCWKV